MSAPAPRQHLPSVTQEQGVLDLQELYKHLEHVTHGDKHLAYYGQLRAKGHGHSQALTETIQYYGLTNYEWYNNRFKKGGA